MLIIRRFAILISAIFIFSYASGQKSVNTLNGSRYIQTAVPFLTIAPDSRAGAMGDVGVATSPDINSMHWNPAKYARIANEGGVSISYSPWLSNLVSDINLYYLSGYKRLDRQQVLAASLLYFTLGEIDFTDREGQTFKTAKPNEFALDVAYSRLLSENLSGSIAFRYIFSDLTNGVGVDGTDAKAGQSFAADVSLFYSKKISLGDKSGNMAYGLNISNIGNKITYTKDQDKDFIPTNLRLGGALTVNLDDYNALTFATDFNKLLVPTPDSINEISDIGVVKGIFQSFYDASGGFKEEMQEITWSAGMEYWYRKQFAIRAGYFNENQNKGNRKYFTMGVGLKLNVLAIDFSYLIPRYANNPLANTLRFTLLFDFDAFRKLKQH